MILPPLPKWNETTDDIDSNEVWRRAQDYERSFLPRDLIFPHAGQIWEAVGDAEVHFCAWIPKTIMPGGRARLREGERVRILPLDDPRPVQVRFQPVRYHELEESIVPSEMRSRPGYSHYVLCLRMARTICCLPDELGFFHELFRLAAKAG